VGVYPAHVVARYAVHDDKRTAHASYVETVVELARLRRVLHHAHSGNLSGEHVLHVLVLCGDDVLALYGGNRTGEVGFLHRSVSHYDNLSQLSLVLRYADVHVLSGFHLYALISYI